MLTGNVVTRACRNLLRQLLGDRAVAVFLGLSTMPGTQEMPSKPPGGK